MPNFFIDLIGKLSEHRKDLIEVDKHNLLECKQIILKHAINETYANFINKTSSNNFFDLIYKFPYEHVKNNSSYKQCFENASIELINDYIKIIGVDNFSNENINNT